MVDMLWIAAMSLPFPQRRAACELWDYPICSVKLPPLLSPNFMRFASQLLRKTLLGIYGTSMIIYLSVRS